MVGSSPSLCKENCYFLTVTKVERRVRSRRRKSLGRRKQLLFREHLCRGMIMSLMLHLFIYLFYIYFHCLDSENYYFAAIINSYTMYYETLRPPIHKTSTLKNYRSVLTQKNPTQLYLSFAYIQLHWRNLPSGVLRENPNSFRHWKKTWTITSTQSRWRTKR